MNIKSPTRNDIPSLRALWKEAFSDTDSFLDSFFETAFSPERALCIADGEGISAAMYWFDCECLGKRIAYIYAVATDKAQRGRGLCTLLMNEAHRRLLEQGYVGAILVPGEAGLFDFYGRLGYKVSSSVREFSTAASGEPIELRPVDAEEYAKIRRSLLPDRGVIQEKENLSFLFETNALYAGEGFLLAAWREKDFLFASELLGDVSLAPHILSSLGCYKGHFRTVGEEKPFAMYLPLSGDADTPSYFGLAFD